MTTTKERWEAAKAASLNVLKEKHEYHSREGDRNVSMTVYIDAAKPGEDAHPGVLLTEKTMLFEISQTAMLHRDMEKVFAHAIKTLEETNYEEPTD